MVTSENSQPPIPTRSSYYSSIVDQPFSPYFLHNGQNEIIQRLTEIKMPYSLKFFRSIFFTMEKILELFWSCNCFQQ